MECNRLKIGVFVSCCLDQFMTTTAQNLVKILEESGAECHYPSALTCCGQRLFLNGDLEGAKTLGVQLIEAYRQYDYVVTCSSGCAAYLRHSLRTLFSNSALYNEALQLSGKTYDICDFIVNITKRLPSRLSFPHKVAFLDHGRTLRDYGLHDEPRLLLRSFEGIEIVEIGELDTDLLFASDFTPIAMKLIDQVVQKALTQGAHYIVVTEPSLALQINGYCAKKGIDIKCRHIIDIMSC